MGKTEHNENRMQSTKGCDSCRFCGVMSTMDKTVQFVCRKNPPVVSAALTVTPNGPGWATATSWPGVSKTDWCGEWQAVMH